MVIRKAELTEQDLEEAGRGRPPKSQGQSSGQSNQTIADVVDGAKKDLDTDLVISNQGVIEDTLDRVLKVNERINKRGGDDFVNVIFVGEGGTGKTKRIRAWAHKNNINLYEVRAAGMDDTDLGGAITPDKEGKVVNRLTSTEFDVLNQPRSVLFLDEYNRAPKSVRTNLLELINSHVVPDPREPSGQRKLDGFLFTVAAINPSAAGVAGYDVDELDTAEKSRFEWVDVPAEAANCLNYLTQKFNKELESAEDDDEKLELKRKLELSKTLLTSRQFKFDTREDIDRSLNGLPLSNRTLTQLLVRCDGTKDDFLALWNRFCNSDKKNMAERILADYHDIDDKANDALKSHDSESSVFKQEVDNYSKLMDILNRQS